MSNTTIEPKLPIKPRDIDAKITDRKKLNVKKGTFVQPRDETRRSRLGLPDIRTLYEKDPYFNEALKSEETTKSYHKSKNKILLINRNQYCLNIILKKM